MVLSSSSSVPSSVPAPERMAAYAAPSLFQPHSARQAIRDAHARRIPPLVGVFQGISSVALARFTAPMGFDATWLDWEHTACNIETMTTIVHETMFMSGGRTIPFVRVPGHDHALIGFALDCGASIIVPQVETVEQCQHIVAATKYGSTIGGTRSAPPFRLVAGVTDRPMHAGRGLDLHRAINDQAALMIQVESLAGVRNLDAMLTACPGVDIVWLGEVDCRVSMNLPANGGMSGGEPEWEACVELFEATLAKHDKPRGGFAPTEGGVRACADKGYSFIVFDTDVARLMGLVQSFEDAKRESALR